MELVIVSGMSGAGKSTCLRALEDLGFFCMDNIIPQLIPDAVMAMMVSTEASQGFKMAISADVRVGEFFPEVYTALDKLRVNAIKFHLLFLEADDSVLINRYNFTKRSHPLAKGQPVRSAITKERTMLADLKREADIVIDTSALDERTLKQRVFDAFGNLKKADGVAIVTFGFKRGMPKDCDYVLDVRHLANPHYDKNLKSFNGLDTDVRNYVFKDGRAEEFCLKAADLLNTVLKDYHDEVKRLMTIGVGCTGGKHRSVAVAERIKELLELNGHNVAVYHRHMCLE